MDTKLYILNRLPGQNISCDENVSIIVEARNSKEARKIANDNGGDELEFVSKSVWLDKNLSSCNLLKPSGSPGVVIVNSSGG